MFRPACFAFEASPPIFEVVSILGKAETLARLKAAAAVGAAR